MPTRSRLKKLCSAALLAATGLLVRAESAPSTQAAPNIILILADDLGWGDLGTNFQNSRSMNGETASLRTPCIDRLAAEGASLTHHYCAAPVCAPARASLLLGVHQGHANVRDNQFDKALEDNHTVATVLRRAGYATAAIGKWGLHGQSNRDARGADPMAAGHPLNRGFDTFYGYLRHIDGHEHYPKEAPYFGAKARQRGNPQVWDGRTDVTADLDRCYTTDLFTARAKQFIAGHTRAAPGQPFFLYLAYDAPHAVLELPTQAYPAGGGASGGLQWVGRPGRMINTASGPVDSWTHPDYALAKSSAGLPWPDAARRYATAVRRIDDAVGDLVQLLQDLGIDEHTLIVFTSDNGPSDEAYLPTGDFPPSFFASYGPFDGLKRDLWEGGLRVPAIARWPARIPAGRIVSEPSAQWDWLATFAAAAGVPPPARTDGISLLPGLSGQGQPLPRESLVFEYAVAGATPAYADYEPVRRGRVRNQMHAVRIGDLMAVRYDVKSPDAPFEIYDVVRDPKEARNLASQPELAGLQSRLQALVLQSRLPDRDAPRPYDDVAVPASDQVPANLQPGVEWRAYAGDFPWLPDFRTLSPVASGWAPRLGGGAETVVGATGFEYAGYLRVPVDGEYSFHLAASVPVSLRLHATTLIDGDFGYTLSSGKTAKIQLRAGWHPLRLALLGRPGQSASLDLTWSGPGFVRRRLDDGGLLARAVP